MSKPGGFDSAAAESLILNTIAGELSLDTTRVASVITLLKEGATVPFIARYRKEITGSMDEVQIRTIEERKTYLQELEERRNTILNSIQEQDKLTDELKKKILAASTKTELEDLYLPYKPKRRTRAAIAREKGLEPLAQRILDQPLDGNPLEEGRAFIDDEEDVKTPEDALKWAREIVAETVVEDADVRSMLRKIMWSEGLLSTKAATKRSDGETKGADGYNESKGADRAEGAKRTKFEDYYDYKEAVAKIPSHRYLAIRRGETEGVLKASIEFDEDNFKAQVESKFNMNPASPFSGELVEAISSGIKRRLIPAVETDLRVDLKLRSDKAAVEIFAENLENLLLAPPFGGRPVLGIDPGLRTGCKCAAVDGTGKYLENITIYPARGDDAIVKSKAMLASFIRKHLPEAIAVGNGTGGRETERLAREVIRENSGLQNIIVTTVNEAGASVYSASDIAREEFPQLDLTVRGAISIARRLQDPLAELVKIDPKSIGVGQYQHDVHQPLLQTKLHQVVETCVNRVGVELNTASASLLSYVAGVGPTLANRIISHRQKNGAFESRKKLLGVKGLGPKTYEQAAGFLRVYESKHPLDRSAVHPERYKLVEKMASDLGAKLQELVGNAELASKIDLEPYIGDGVGEPTLRDIISELSKPGRDPRETFEAPGFREDVNEIEDLKTGMSIEGVVTNVTAFGAFVDVGVHQDGLVHISQLADRFVKNPGDVVKVGDKLKVKVLNVDLERRRISLTARTDIPVGKDSGGNGDQGGKEFPVNDTDKNNRYKKSDKYNDRGQERRGKRSIKQKHPENHGVRQKDRHDRRSNRAEKSRNNMNNKSNKFTNNPFAALLGKKTDG